MVDLKALRLDVDLKQSDVAFRVGISRSAYANIENKKRTPSVSCAKRIANVLHFDWTRFFSDAEPSARNQGGQEA